MKSINTVDELYRAIDELIIELSAAGYSALADILNHRLHKVAWTTGSELLEELQKILSDTLRAQETTLPTDIVCRVSELLRIITDFLAG